MEWRLTQTPYNDDRTPALPSAIGAPGGCELSSNLSGRFLCFPRIVGRILVADLPWADAMKLANCFAFTPRRVVHAGWPVTKAARRTAFHSATFERVSR